MIIVLEGLPASGKTSISNYLQQHIGFYKVNESLGFLGGINLSEDQSIIFTETLKKYNIAKNINGHVIIDRGYISMLAWDYCTEQVWGLNNLDIKTGWVIDAFGNGTLYHPDLYIYLRLSPETSFIRRPREQNHQDIWTWEAGLRHCNTYYDNFFRSVHIKHRTVVVNAESNFDTVIDDVLRQLPL